MKGLCEEFCKNLGGLITMIEGKYNPQDLELVESEMRNIFDHPIDAQLLRNSLISMKKSLQVSENGVNIEKEELDISHNNA